LRAAPDVVKCVIFRDRAAPAVGAKSNFKGHEWTPVIL
jgi:hypothetical protein